MCMYVLHVCLCVCLYLWLGVFAKMKYLNPGIIVKRFPGPPAPAGSMRHFSRLLCLILATAIKVKLGKPLNNSCQIQSWPKRQNMLGN